MGLAAVRSLHRWRGVCLVLLLCLVDQQSLLVTGQSAAPSYCVGIDATPGIKHTDVMWPNWVPVLGWSDVVSYSVAGAPGLGQLTDAIVPASNLNIPKPSQGQVTNTPADCNTACCSIDQCIGYTWIGSNKQCWLHSSVAFFLSTVKQYMDPTSPGDGLVDVPPGTTLGRVVRGSTYNWTTCANNLTAYQDRNFGLATFQGLTPSTVPNTDLAGCNRQCAAQPRCMGMRWRDINTSSIASCQLLSEASGGLVYEERDVNNHQFAAPVQSCTPANNTLPPLTPTPATPPTPSNPACADLTPGIRATGKVWPGWQPVTRTGWTTDQGTSATAPAWSHHYIPDNQQGTPSSNAQDCNCKCAALAACVGFTWLGGDKKQCWMHSWVQGTVDPVTTYQDSQSNTVPVPADTVIGRVVKYPGDSWPACSDTTIFSKRSIVLGTVIPTPSSAAGSRYYTWQSCNQACGNTPRCTAYSWAGPSANASATCTLYTRTQGGLVFNSSIEAISFAAPLQTCQAYLVEQPLPPPPPPPPVAATTDSGGGGGGIPFGIIAGVAAAGVVAIVAIGFIVWYVRKRKRRIDGDNKYEATAPTSPTGSAPSPRPVGDDGTPRRRRGTPKPMVLPGLAPGEVFTRATAFEYSWLGQPVDKEASQPVEAGINDHLLDAMVATSGRAPPVVELSQEQLRKEVLLVNDGLLGRGATALVFQCVWPKRFGEHALLAAKVLKDGHEVDALVLQSFAYEANVLASCDHPCVVRLYGYCLEPPTVCLILELLPCSLKDVLYGSKLSIESSARRSFHPSLIPSSVRANMVHLTGTGTNLSNHRLTGTNLSNARLTGTNLPPGSPLPTGSQLPTNMSAGPRPSFTLDTPNTSNPPTADHSMPLRDYASGEVDASGSLAAGASAAANGEGAAQNGKKHAGPGLQLPLPPMNVTALPSPSSALATQPISPSSPTVPPTPGGEFGFPVTSPPSQSGTPLASAARSALNMMQVLCIATDVAAGLAYLHDRTLLAAAAAPRQVMQLEANRGQTTFTRLDNSATKIVHRDLKPANILLNSQGRAKISDFGLARRTKNTTLNTERLGAGTLPYMAPELLASAHAGAYKLAPTNRVDIYSLAMIMWEMLSGQQPWANKSEINIMAAVIRNKRPDLPQGVSADPLDPYSTDLSMLPATLSTWPEFNGIIRQCWSQRELKRPTAVSVFGMLSKLMLRFGIPVSPELGNPVAHIDSPASSERTSMSSGTHRWE